MGTNERLTIYNHKGGGGCYRCLYPKLNPVILIIDFFAKNEFLKRKDGKVISDPVRTREE